MKYTALFLLCFLCAINARSQTYTFSRDNCTMEAIKPSGQIAFSWNLADLTWAEVVSDKYVEVKDGITSLTLYKTQIRNFVNDQVDSLILTVSAWKDSCISESGGGTAVYRLSVNGDTLFLTEDAAKVDTVVFVTDVEIGVACSDLTTALTTGTNKAYFRMPYAMSVTDVRASVLTAPSGGVLTVDINDSGTTILSTKLTIDSGEKTSESAATPPVISDSALADDAEITVDIDGVNGSPAGLIVWIIGTRD